MSVARIKELIDLMNENSLAELELEEGDFKVRLCKQGAGVPAVCAAPAPLPAASAPAAGAPAAEAGLVPIKSPIVGTFYASPSPEADSFVAEGAKVNKETVVCIVEAMKIMNEIKAGVSGTIVKRLVENGEPVEYGQPLFLVRP